MKERRELARKPWAELGIRPRCELLAVNVSTLYRKPVPPAEDEVTLMNEIRDIYAARPAKGYRRICNDLNDLGYAINRKRVLRLMRLMGLAAVYPKKNLSKRRLEDAVYPYLLRENLPQKPHDCWCVDITYIRMNHGFVYLTALIDVVSRHIMGWYVSTTLETESCLRALEMALGSGCKPVILNSDQGCQFTSDSWVSALKEGEIQISMDGKGRCLDNIYIERFWRTLKYEEVYFRTYDTVAEARQSIGTFMVWYNTGRRHQGLGYRTPHMVMTGENGINLEFLRPVTASERPVDKWASCSKLPILPTGKTATTPFFKEGTREGFCENLSLNWTI